MQDDNAFRAAQNGFQTGGFIDSQISAKAGADWAAATRPITPTLPGTPAGPAFNAGGAYYGGPARPFPTWLLGWFFLIVAGYVLARPQTLVMALGALLSVPALTLAGRVGAAERPRAWAAFKCACVAMFAYMLTKVVLTKTSLLGSMGDLESDAIGIAVYGAIVTLMLRRSFGSVGGFIKAYAAGALTVLLLTVGMGVYVLYEPR